MSYVIEQHDALVRNSSANIAYDLDFSRALQHLVRVVMSVKNITTDTVVLVMPSWTPGSYKIRDYSAHQGNVEVYSGGKERTALPFSYRDKSSLVIQTNGSSEIQVEYVVYGNERSVRTNHINRNHAFIVPAATFMYVEGRMQEMHHVRINLASVDWLTVSTPLSPVQPEANRDLLLGAINYDVLVDSPIEVGNHTSLKFESQGAMHEVAVYSTQPVDVEWLVKQVQRIVEVESQIFNGVPYDRYVFLVHVYPGGAGGLEHARGSVNAVDPKSFLDKGSVSKLLSLLCHEYFHTWNIKRIRPIELGPFDYQREVYTPMLWLAEGLTSYYDDLLHYRCGFATETEYLATLAKEHILKLMHVPGRHRLSIRDSSYLAWVKLYQASNDGANRFPSYYLAGGVVMLLLDLYVIDHSDGNRSLDDALRALWKRYLDNPGQGMHEDETIAIMERATGVQFRDLLLTWLSGTTELPISDMFAAVGFDVVTSMKQPEQISFGEKRDFADVPASVYVGWTLAETNGKVIVRTVEDNSPAQRAGIGIDDELIALGENRVTSSNHVAQLLASQVNQPVAVTAQTDGTIYATTLTTQPEPTITITSMPTLSAQQRKNREAWLQRNL